MSPGAEAVLEPCIIPVGAIVDHRGRIAVYEPLPFDVQRVYILFDVPTAEVRGSHAHRVLHQMLVVTSGSLDVQLTDGLKEWEFRLSAPTSALYIPPGLWRTLSGFSSACTCVVLASEVYTESDYIRNYSEFIEWRERSARLTAKGLPKE